MSSFLKIGPAHGFLDISAALSRNFEREVTCMVTGRKVKVFRLASCGIWCSARTSPLIYATQHVMCRYHNGASCPSSTSNSRWLGLRCWTGAVTGPLLASSSGLSRVQTFPVRWLSCLSIKAYVVFLHCIVYIVYIVYHCIDTIDGLFGVFRIHRMLHDSSWCFTIELDTRHWSNLTLRRGTGKAAIQETTIDNAHQNSVVETWKCRSKLSCASWICQKKTDTSDFKKCHVL